jgi:hypothetical protein
VVTLIIVAALVITGAAFLFASIEPRQKEEDDA